MAVPVISRSRNIVGESAGFAEFLVQLSVPSTQMVSVQYHTSDGETTNYDDYNGVNTTTLSFAPGETVKTVSIGLTDDTAAGKDGPFHFTLINPTNATVDTGLMTATIPDNDGALPDMGAPVAVQGGGAPQPTVTQALGDSLPLPGDHPASAAADGNGLFAVYGALSDIVTTIQPLAAAPPTITQAQVALLIDGFEQTLIKIEANLVAQVFGDSLPLLGDNLADAAAGGTSALHYVTALKAALNSGLATLAGLGDVTETQIEQALLNALNAAGIASGAGPQIDLTNLNDIKLTMNTSKSFAAFDTALDAGFGLPGLGIQASGTAHNVFNYTLNFGVGLDASGFYLNTANTSAFNVGFTTTIPGLDVSANLSRLHFHVTDESATDGDGVAPTSFTGNFVLDLLDPSGADNKLRISELSAGADLLDATLNGNANVNLNLASDLGTAVLPSINADLNFAWGFNNASVIAGDANTSFGGVPQVAFKNVSLGLGSFFSDFAGPVLQKVQLITEPLQPILDALTKPIPALVDLVTAAGLGGLVPTSLLKIMEAAGTVSPEDVARIELLDKIAAFVNAFHDGGDVKIDLGDFNLGGLDPRAAVFQLANAAPNEIRHAIDAILQSGVLSGFLGDAAALPGGGMAFPIIQNPQTAIGLLFGKDVNFFTYDAPDFIAYSFFDEFFRLAGPLGIRLTGNVSAVAKLDFGYDSHGLIEFSSGGFSDPGKIFNGFFVVDQNGPEATFDASLEAFLAVNLILAESGVGGGILGHAEINLEDPTPGDNKLRVDEIIVGLSDGCLFDLMGKVTAGVGAYVTIGWSPFSHTFNFDGPSTELVNFDGTACDADGVGNDQPVLARMVGANLNLNIGVDAPLRIRGDNTDTNEFFGVEHVSGAAGGEVVRVLAFYLLPQEYTLGSGGEIRANGGVLDDTIVLAAAVLTGGVLHGGEGNDRIWGGAGADSLFGDAGMDFLDGRDGNDTLDGGADFDLLDGGAGTDQLRGGANADILIGGSGADQLDGGSGDDTASYITSAGAVLLDLANLAASTGDAAGDVFVSIEHFYGSDFGDTLRGDAGSNYLAGDKGGDLIEGRDGNDLLIGGIGADMLNGGAGVDYVSYIDGQVAVTVSLATGIGSGGFAQGDVLISIENLEGVDTEGLPGDVLEGNDVDNEIRGLGGVDTLRGLGGNDLLSGGADNDRLEGGAGNDTLLGEFGDDTLLGGTGIDMLLGSDGSDSLDGGGDADKLYGEAGGDSLDGGAGNDLLDGGAGVDALNDLAGDNQLYGGADDDLLTAGSGNDLLDGGIGNDRLNAGDGTNTLAGGDGNDELFSGSGADSLVGGTGNDQLAAGDGANTLNGGDGDDGLLSGSGADNLEGGLGNDTANSGAGNDIVFGGEGNDLLDVGIGADRVDGGAGIDFLSVGSLRGPVQDLERRDHLFGGLGFDTITADFSNQTIAMAVTAGQTQSLVFADGAEALDFENVHDFFTGSGDDVLHLDGAADDHFANLLKTGAGNDTVYSGAGSDNVDAGDGDDFVNGGTNDAVLTFGGFGVVTGFTGPAETLAGGLGIDTLSFEGFSRVFPDNVAKGVRFGVAVNLATNATGGAAMGITISGFENIIGTDYGDNLIGNDGANFFDPLRGGGNTESATTSGPDRIDGGGGEDTLHIDFSLADLPDSQGVYTNGYTIYRINVDKANYVDNYYYMNIEHLDITGASKGDSLYPYLSGYSDVLRGLGGDDTLAGNSGADTLLGGDGNDLLTAQGRFAAEYQGNAGGHDVLDGGAGDDLVEDVAGGTSVSGINFSYFSPLNADALFRLDGGTGFDRLSADFSNQAAIVWDSATPTNLEFADGAYARNFEQLRYFATGAGNDVITQRGRVDNTFSLGAGDDTVNSGLGRDILDGGVGNDTAVLDFSVGDTAEMSGLQSTSNYNDGAHYYRTLIADNSGLDDFYLRNFERVQVTGTSKADTIFGTIGDDTLIGGDGNDVLDGLSGGNNFLDGGNGDDVLKGSYGNQGSGANDTMYGGAGNDTFTPYTGSDTVYGGTGNDTIKANDYPGTAGYGDDLFDGGDGDDVVSDVYFSSGTSYATVTTRLHLDGGAGFDTLSADFGNQTQAITFIGGAGNSVNFADGSYFRNFEALGSFTSGSGNDTLTTSGRVNNNIAGGTGDDIINPGLGIDYVLGGDGDDLLTLDFSVGDDANVSGVVSGQYVQRRDLNTNALIDDIYAIQFERYQITGGSKADDLRGGSFADVLTGNAGNDTLSGGGGNDTLIGGAGDDTYLVDAVGDVVTELALGGADTVQTTLGSYSLAAQVNVENLAYIGGGAFTGTGNAAANAITGRTGGDMLDGGAGNDTLDGGAGADTMIGGDGSDLYYVDNVGDLVVETNASPATGGNDTVYSSLSAYTLTANVENLRLLAIGAANGIGNSLNNMLYASVGDNVLDGSAGIDTVSYADAASGVTVSLASGIAQVTGGSGSDTLVSIENLTGSNSSDQLTGNSLANTLNGAADADTMIGGDGNDFYYVDNAGDQVTETNAVLASGGSDTVYSTLSAYTLTINVENLRLLAAGVANGTGNGLNNTLYAGAGNNILNGSAGIDTASYAYAAAGITVSLASGITQVTGGSGSDRLVSIENLTGSNSSDKLTGNNLANTLNGMAGADTMIGGDGNDFYYVDNVGDLVTETNASLATGGNDTVYSTLSAYTLTANVENLRLLAAGVANGTGNGLNNTLYAGAGNNTLNGSAGIDTVSYAYAAAGITVSLASGIAQVTGGSGSDTLVSIENLTGSNTSDKFTGNNFANILSGGAGNDILTSGAGNDTLYGGAGNDKLNGDAGADKFVFNTALNSATNVDKITGFSIADDTIVLENAIFAKFVAPGAVAAGNFVSGAGTVAADADDYLLYNTTTGALSYDTDGVGAGIAVQFVTLTGIPAVTAADFLIV